METIEQDILKISEGIVAHQVNCCGYVGGLAAKLGSRYPRVRRNYQKYCDRYRNNPSKLLGKIEPVWAFYPSKQLLVLNLFGQQNISRTEQATDYKALEAIADKIKEKQESSVYGDIYFPYKMGCGLGGGDWQIVSRIFEGIRGYWCFWNP